MILSIYANNIAIKGVLELIKPLEYCYVNCLLVAKVQDTSANATLIYLSRSGKLDYLYYEEE